MTRREALVAIGGGLAWVGWPGTAALAQRKTVDPDFVRMWLEAQRDRPAVLTAHARIAPADEPGDPLRFSGQLFREDSRTTVTGAVIFAYHTDRNGLYVPPGQSGWRLRGWARTDDDGRFVFTTIRPGPYPGRNAPAHVHLSADGPGIDRQTLPSLRFADDPLLTDADRAAAGRAGQFGDVRPVTTQNGIQVCDMRVRLTGEYVF